MSKKNGQLIIIGILAFAILFMSVGFAAYSQTLNIQGTATVNVVEWSVRWKPESLTTFNDSVALTSSSLTNTDVSFAATLSQPGDKIHFKVTAINDGDLDAYLKKITMTPLTAAQAKYLTFTVKYGNNTYSTTTDNLSFNLLVDDEEDAEITITYINPENASDLPTQDVTVDVDIHFDYEQITS